LLKKPLNTPQPLKIGVFMSEHLEQVKVMQWCIRNGIHDVILAIPNGGKRDVRTAIKLKAEGVKKGVSDMFLALPKNGYHGLWLELKDKGGKPTKEQKEWIYKMRELGYAADVAVGHQQAIEVLELYIMGKWEALWS
jgi:hypothetical protein